MSLQPLVRWRPADKTDGLKPIGEYVHAELLKALAELKIYRGLVGEARAAQISKMAEEQTRVK